MSKTTKDYEKLVEVGYKKKGHYHPVKRGIPEVCHTCGGTGRIMGEICPDCEGIGEEYK